jgi:putative transposase
MALFYVKENEKVLFKDKEAVIVRVDSIDTVTIEEIKGNKFHTVKIHELKPVKQNLKNDLFSLENLSEKKWEVALKRFEIIKPLLEIKRTKELFEKVAKEHSIGIATLYRWIKLYDEHGTVSSILGKPKNGGRGKSRLSKEQDKIIDEAINKIYLNSSRKSINRTIRAINETCIAKNILAPHATTIRNRIKDYSEEEIMRRRVGVKEANYKFKPIKGSSPEVHYPYSLVQIDHTRVDIILVDEHTRAPYKRPWLTVAIDSYSRMVVGFYLSFETPGALGTGLCIAHSILPKEIWLEKRGVKAHWPCWGKIDTIHLDNAKEFRGNVLKKACQNYNINIEFRPVATPHWGGQVERLLGTFSKEIHDLPGTTFSSPLLRKNYDSQKNASFTLNEFEKWLTLYITNVYHLKIHSSLGMTPLDKFTKGILGDDDELGIGIVPKIQDERRLKLDFMPYIERTIQEYGVIIDHVTYYHDVMRKYIHSKDKNGLKRKFLFRRDPRDISIIFFYDPEANEYFDIPYRDTSLPPISIWEFNDVVRELNKKKVNLNEKAIFETYKMMDELETSAIKKTRRFKKIDKKLLNNKNEESDDLITQLNENVQEELLILPFEDIDDESLK